MLGRLQTEQSSVEVQLPKLDSASASPSTAKLMAKGPGPTFNWIVATVTNSGDTAREAVITIPDQGFAGSGFLPVKRSGVRLYSAVLTGAGTLDLMPVPGESAYLLNLPAGGTAAIAFETAAAAVPP